MNVNHFAFPSRRSDVLAQQGMVATSQPLAAQAGLDVLKVGGNAVDAAVATAAALCVVEPCSTGIGGDAFVLIWSAADQRLYGLNASGPAPSALNAQWIREQGYNQIPERGPIPVTVPGALRGWELALERFGSFQLKQLLGRPIRYARDGFPVSPLIAQSWHRSTSLMSEQAESRRCWLPGGRAPRMGEIFSNPDFAHTLEIISCEGIDSFYQGPIGQAIVDTVQETGGLLSLEDMVSFQAQWVEPISVEYQPGLRFHEIPPNGQGLTALMALNLVKNFDQKDLGYGSADYWHLMIEATKLAFADAAAYIADPAMVDVPVESLLSPGYAEQRRALIDLSEAGLPDAGDPGRHGDTVYLAAADEAGNMVSWIQSLYMGFGSGLTAKGTGVHLQNRGAGFVLEDGHPNQVAPGKRPYHTIIPGFITRDGQPWCSFGVMGGFMQPQGHLQVGLNLVEFEMTPQQALDAPRFNWLTGKRLAIEEPVSDKMRTELLRRGHDLVPKKETASYPFGGGQVIVRDPDSGVFTGGSDPRKDGAAVGF